MNAQEFKAWLTGFAEGIEGQPSKEQWLRVLEQAKTLGAEPSLALAKLAEQQAKYRTPAYVSRDPNVVWC